MNLLETALELADQGCYVFPVAHKRPLIKWKEGASCLPEVIEQMPWGAASHVAVSCEPSKLWVIDVDDPKAMEEYQPPLTRVQETGRKGGKHFIYRAADFDQRNGAGIPVKGMDVRGNGGMFVWYGAGPLQDEEIRPWPLKAKIKDPSKVRAEAPISDGMGASSAFGLNGLAEACRAVREATEGGRNHALNNEAFWIGQLIAGGHLNGKEAAEGLMAAAMAAGLSRDESRATIISGSTAGGRHPVDWRGEAVQPELVEDANELMDRWDMNGQSEALRQKLLDDVYVLQGLAVLGEITVFYAKPNTGKTLLLLRLLQDSIQAGRIAPDSVTYVNADDGFKGMVTKLELAEEHGYRYYVPGQNGFEAAFLEPFMRKMIADGSARGRIVAVDTLKKFTELMDKKISSGFARTCRDFALAGGTFLASAHANKHMDAEGFPVPSGTSDIGDDFDCVYTLREVDTSQQLVRTIEFRNLKMRSNVELTAAFTYDANPATEYREKLKSVLRASKSVLEEAQQKAKVQSELEKDAAIIKEVEAAIFAGQRLRTEIAERVHKELAVSKARILGVLDKRTGTFYEAGHRWRVQLGQHNAKAYAILAGP